MRLTTLFSLAAAVFGLAALGYLSVTYVQPAWMRYNPPWQDPAFYVALASTLAVLVTSAYWPHKQKRWRFLLFVTLGIILMLECGLALWFDKKFMEDCGNQPNVFAPGCPDLPYK